MRRLTTIAALAGILMLAGCSAPVEESAPAPEPTVSTAQVVQDAMDANIPEGVSAPSWWVGVTEIEDMYEGTVRIHVQQNLTDTGREDLARGVFNFVAASAEPDALETVVVRDASGRDSNHYR